MTPWWRLLPNTAQFRMVRRTRSDGAGFLAALSRWGAKRYPVGGPDEAAAVAEDKSIAGIEADGFVEISERTVQVALPLAAEATAAEVVRFMRVEAYDVTVMGGRTIELALFRVGVPAIAEG